MKNKGIPERFSLTDAAKYLGVSRTKLWKMVADGVLRATVDPLDTRKKWVTRADLEALKAQSLKAA